MELKKAHDHEKHHGISAAAQENKEIQGPSDFSVSGFAINLQKNDHFRINFRKLP